MVDHRINRNMQRQAPYAGPLLGALLRQAHQQVLGHIARAFEEKGYALLQAAATQPLYEHPGGLRLTQLASLAGVSKQAMAEMVDSMIEAGYIEQHPDPTDGRARLLRLTARGRRVGAFARDRVREIEALWEKQLGRERIAALRDTLHAIAEANVARPDTREKRGGTRAGLTASSTAPSTAPSTPSSTGPSSAPRSWSHSRRR
jgi:DNA-binding MarR family transcriptional regulator